ncbi:tRNA methyltransferase, partial [Mycena rebaudengoi]
MHRLLRSCILSRPTTLRTYHRFVPPNIAPAPFLGLKYTRKSMEEPPVVIGDTRGASPSAEQHPAAKKPRLEAPVSVPTPVSVPNPAPPKKMTKKMTKRQKRKPGALPEPCSPEDVLWREIRDVLGAECVDTAFADGTDMDAPIALGEMELEVVALCSTGSALATSPSSPRPWVVVVPGGLPGETVHVRVYRHARMHSVADLLAVVTPNPALRDQSRVQCRYFGTCAGCQYQMLSYEKQLELKRDVVVKAYRNFSDLPASALPPIESTLPSPKQYGYRTKITPHFEAPNKHQRATAKGTDANGTDRPEWLKIGFNLVGSQKVMDIEDCPLATPIIRQALPIVRADIIKNIYTYKRGSSLILRDSLRRPTEAPPPPTDADADAVAEDSVGISVSTDLSAEGLLTDPADPDLAGHVALTSHRDTAREQVGPWLFEYPAGSFFQNNNSVLPLLTGYVEARIFGEEAPPLANDTAASGASGAPTPTRPAPTPTHLVDAYCGAGLFAIALSPRFARVAGIELSRESIRAATHNAHALNGIPAAKLSFQSGDAADIFKTVGAFPRGETVLVIDPPRKGCNEAFIAQLIAFGARTVVYVSCNVHTQARDVGMILRGSEEKLRAERAAVEGRSNGRVGGRYVLESLRGIDLFPQTAHVESVAVLRLV